MNDTVVIDGSVSLTKVMDGDVGVVVISSGEAPRYEGPYDVIPRLYDQSLDTNGKLMRDDVTVYEIPITRTSNPEGGQTVLIG